jgi:hypothetical protein
MHFGRETCASARREAYAMELSAYNRATTNARRGPRTSIVAVSVVSSLAFFLSSLAAVAPPVSAAVANFDGESASGSG